MNSKRLLVFVSLTSLLVAPLGAYVLETKVGRDNAIQKLRVYKRAIDEGEVSEVMLKDENSKTKEVGNSAKEQQNDASGEISEKVGNIEPVDDLTEKDLDDIKNAENLAAVEQNLKSDNETAEQMNLNNNKEAEQDMDILENDKQTEQSGEKNEMVKENDNKKPLNGNNIEEIQNQHINVESGVATISPTIAEENKEIESSKPNLNKATSTSTVASIEVEDFIGAHAKPESTSTEGDTKPMDLDYPGDAPHTQDMQIAQNEDTTLEDHKVETNEQMSTSTSPKSNESDTTEPITSAAVLAPTSTSTENPLEKQSCYSCASADDANCITKPNKTVSCTKTADNKNGCFTMVKVDGKETSRGCIADMTHEDQSYCESHPKLCDLCFDQGCNNRKISSSAMRTMLKPLMSIFCIALVFLLSL